MTALPRKTTFHQMIAGLLGDMYWKSILYDRDENGKIVYEGRNAYQDAEQDASDWYIWKNTWQGSSLVRTEGPLTGAWNNRDNLEWEFAYINSSEEQDPDMELKSLIGQLLTEMKIANAYLSLMANETITEEDLK